MVLTYIDKKMSADLENIPYELLLQANKDTTAAKAQVDSDGNKKKTIPTKMKKGRPTVRSAKRPVSKF